MSKIAYFFRQISPEGVESLEHIEDFDSVEQVESVFIYALCDPESMTVRYIGKAKNLEHRLKAHMNDKDDTRKARWIRSLRERNLAPVVIVLEIIDEQKWQEAERRWIALYRNTGLDLTNHTDGGEGLTNASEETRQKLSAIGNAMWNDPEQREKLLTAVKSPERRAKISAALTGKQKSPDHVAKLPQNQPGWHHSEATRQKLAEVNRGRKHKPETINKLVEINKGNQYGKGNKSRLGQKIGDEERRKRSLATRGKPKSPEHREKIRLGALRRWERQRNVKEKENDLCKAHFQSEEDSAESPDSRE